MVSLFGAGSNPYQQPTGWGTFTEGASGQKEAFAAVEKGVLRHMGVSARSVRDFQIQNRSQTATFTHPSTKAIVEVDLPAIQDPSIQAALKKYYDVFPGARKNMSYAIVAPNCKGDLGGKKALVRTTTALQNLRADLDFETHIPAVLASKSSPKERLRYSRRFIFAQAFLNKWNEGIAEKFKEKQTQLKDPALPDAQANQLRKELGELRRLNEKLKEIDLYALSKALEHIPEERVNPVTLDALVEDIEKAVLEDVKPKKFFGLSKANHSEADKLYARQVAGMAVRGRKEFFAYCKRVFGYRVQESVTDNFMREALVFASMDPATEYTAEGFKNSVLLRGMSPELRQEMQDMLEGVGRKVSLACRDEMPWSDYIDQTVPSSATKEEAEKAQFDKMQKTVDTHRKGVQGKMAGALPKAVVPAPGVSSAVRTGLGMAAAGAVATAAAHYAGVPIPASVRSVFTDHPGWVAAAVPFLDTLRHRVHNFVRPVVRDPVSGTPRRKWSFKRMVLGGVGLGLAYYAGQAALAAAAPFVAAMEPATMSAAAPHMLMSAPLPMSGLEPPQVPGMLAQAGIFATLGLQAAGRAVDFVWSSSHVPTGLGARTIPLLGWTWQGNIPTMAALDIGSRVSSRVPLVRNVAEFALRPLRYAANIGMAAPVVQSVGQGISDRIGLPAMLNAFREGASTDGCPSYVSNPFEQMATPERLACKAVMAWGRFQYWWQYEAPSFFSSQNKTFV
ncbi:MAG: hypothetical protein P0S96_01910 [Simkaniaceae bacterium]|nr:hypothetical protein [Candidatus Sacchlamyda saccharinae]